MEFDRRGGGVATFSGGSLSTTASSITVDVSLGYFTSRCAMGSRSRSTTKVKLDRNDEGRKGLNMFEIGWNSV